MPRRPDPRWLSAAHPRRSPRYRSGHWLLHRQVQPSRRQSSDHRRPQHECPSLRLAATAQARRHGGRGRCPETAPSRGTVRLGGVEPGDPLPAGADVAQGSWRSRTSPPRWRRTGCCSGRRSWAGRATIRGWRGGSSLPSTDAARSATSTTARTGSARSLPRRSSTSSSRPSARSRSSRPRGRASRRRPLREPGSPGHGPAAILCQTREVDELGTFLTQLPRPIGPIVTGLLPVAAIVGFGAAFWAQHRRRTGLTIMSLAVAVLMPRQCRGLPVGGVGPVSPAALLRAANRDGARSTTCATYPIGKSSSHRSPASPKPRSQRPSIDLPSAEISR